MKNMKKTKSYNIGVYDKSNNLVNYKEILNDAQELKCYYSINGNILNRKYTNEYKDEPSELISSIIEYNDNIMLYPFNIEGETAMRTIQSGESFSSIASPVVSSRIDTYLEQGFSSSAVQCCSVKSDLVEEWLNKL